MRSTRILRLVPGLGLSLAFSLCMVAQEQPAGGQGGQAPGPSPGPVDPGAGGGRTPGGQQPPIGQQPGQRPGPMDPRQQPQQFPEMQRQIYLSGKVVMEDGTAPPDQVVIERVCNGQPRPEGYTDSKGRFSFALGQNASMMMDASVSSAADDFPGAGTGNRQYGATPGRAGISERDLMGCELRASLAGFRSDIVNLAGRRMMDNPDVGTIVLRRLAKVEGFTFSGTTMFAPKDAKKAYEKGLDQKKKKKFADAEKEFQKAVTAYPKFAVAWYELGLMQQQQNKLEEARNSYGESIKADGKYISPYGMLTRLAVAENKWEDVATHTEQLLKLNPYASPEAYFYSAVANFQLKKLDAAEEHAREALKVQGAAKRNPKLNHLLGLILAQKGQYAGAAENMRAYLNAVPDAKDADQVKGQLAEVERMMGGQAAGSQQAQ